MFKVWLSLSFWFESYRVPKSYGAPKNPSGNRVNSICRYILSVPISAYTKAYSTNDVLIGFTDNCKKSLDKSKYVGIPKTMVY